MLARNIIVSLAGALDVTNEMRIRGAVGGAVGAVRRGGVRSAKRLGIPTPIQLRSLEKSKLVVGHSSVTIHI